MQLGSQSLYYMSLKDNHGHAFPFLFSDKQSHSYSDATRLMHTSFVAAHVDPWFSGFCSPNTWFCRAFWCD